MKKIVIILVACISLIACKSDDKKVTPASQLTPEQKEQAAAEMERIAKDSTSFTTIQWIDSTYRDLGKVKEGAQVEVTFRFKNTGTKPLVVTSVSASCGCTVAEKPEKPCLPGEEDIIKAVFDSKDRVGEANKSLYVVANTNPTGTHELKFHVLVTK